VTSPAARLDVRKTYKLYLGGAFPRSESGRSYPVHRGGGEGGEVLAHAAWASRKDARDAVVAARGALPRWSAATAYNRGQVLYRVAEVLEGRRDQLAAEVAAAEDVSLDTAAAQVAAAVDRWVWFAGWSDKIAQVGGNANPVAGPFFNLSVPEPTGVVAVLAPQDSSLLGLTAVVAPAVVAGNTVVVAASERRPLPAVTLAEVFATSDLPGGVVNVLTGPTAELAPRLASHRDVDGLDLTGAADLTSPTWGELEAAAAEGLTRVLRPPVDPPDWSVPAGPQRILAFCEIKTVWHPKGR
jgi:acyl-CoA reductase-like NAD-dependent aldehyde dehydrogenase